MRGVSRAFFVLLPPSESKEPGGHREVAPGLFDDLLAFPREQVLRALAQTLGAASPEEASRLLNARGQNLQRALEATRQLVEGTALVPPAWQRYRGVVWSHLDPASLHEKLRRRILVPSGLYGLSSGTDVIADYRLSMKVSLDGLGNIAKYWRSPLTHVLEKMASAQLVSFLPKEHIGAMGTGHVVSRQLVTVSFLRHDGQGVAGHDAKAVKGIVARRILEDGLEAVEGFNWKGWRGKIRSGQYLVRAPRMNLR